jgi:hypothetical protein
VCFVAEEESRFPQEAKEGKGTISCQLRFSTQTSRLKENQQSHKIQEQKSSVPRK